MNAPLFKVNMRQSSRKNQPLTERSPTLNSSTSKIVNRIECGEFIDDALWATLERLARFQLFALQRGFDTRSISIPIGDFLNRGHDYVQLHVLVMDGVLNHVQEGVADSDGNQPPNYFLNDCSRFSITSRWLEKLQSTSVSAQSIFESSARHVKETSLNRPHWDTDLRKLTINEKLVKQFRCPAINQEAILSAFQEEGWPNRINDPLPYCPSSEAKQRLHETIRSLNRNQIHSLIKFGGDGTGEGVVWHLDLDK